MGYASKRKQREYQRRWIAARRAAWFKVHNVCSSCGTTSELEIHHLKPELKIDHKVWSWSTKRRDEELAKCVVLCRECHDDVTAVRSTPDHGTNARYTSRRFACRCALCRAAHNAVSKAWRALRRTSGHRP